MSFAIRRQKPSRAAASNRRPGSRDTGAITAPVFRFCAWNAIYSAALRTAPTRADFARLFENRPDHLKEDAELWVAAATRDDVTSLEEGERTATDPTLLAGLVDLQGVPAARAPEMA